MNNTEFIESKPLELSYKIEYAQAVRDVIKRANESFVYEVTEEIGKSYVNFYICSPRTTFANAYFHLGILMCEAIREKKIMI